MKRFATCHWQRGVIPAVVLAAGCIGTLHPAPVQAAAAAQYDRGDRGDRDRRGGWDGRGGRGAQTIRCESGDKQARECPIDTRGGVQMTRKLSRSSCKEGQDWGYRRDYVWVSNGCRAEFLVGGSGRGYGGGWGNDRGYGDGQMVQCESVNGRQNYCGAQVRRGVHIQRQLSDTRCVEGRNWGWDRRGVWVSGGCRAQFSID